MAEVRFVVGGVYRNRNGEYEVLSVDPAGGRMEVRFQDGRRQSLDMSTQSRIVQNMTLDAKIEAAQSAPPPRAPRRVSKTLGREFQGMLPEDFTGTVTGTTWRGKKSLGGAVVAQLEQHFRRPFASNPVYRVAQIFLSHHPFSVLKDPDESRRLAKYIVRAEPEGLLYGFYAELPPKGSPDWRRLIESLRRDAALRDLVTALEAEGLHLEGYCWRGAGREPLWPEGATWDDRLRELEAPISEDKYRDLWLVRRLSVQEALDRGTELAGDIGDLFVRLAPVYEAAVDFD